MSAAELARSLAKDKKFRKQLLSAIGHGTIAKRRASKRIGFVAAVTRLGADPKLKSELRKMTKNLENAWAASRRSAVTSFVTRSSSAPASVEPPSQQ